MELQVNQDFSFTLDDKNEYLLRDEFLKIYLVYCDNLNNSPEDTHLPFLDWLKIYQSVSNNKKTMML